MKTLELKHIAPYLPYEVNVYDTRNNCVVKLSICNLKDLNSYDKLILHPLSDLTSSGCIEEIQKTSEGEMNVHMWDDLLWRLERCEKHNAPIDVKRMPYWALEIMFKYHIDAFGLIRESLAISIHEIE